MKPTSIKKRILEILSETPFVNLACKATNTSKASFYRWKKSDKKFSRDVEKALSEGRENFVEVGESLLMKKMKEGNLEAIKYGLRHNSGRYHPLRPTPPFVDLNDATDPFVKHFLQIYASYLSDMMRELKEQDIDDTNSSDS